MIHKREPGFLIMGLTFVPIITEVRGTSGDVGTLRHKIIVALSCCACLLSFLMMLKQFGDTPVSVTLISS